MKNKKRWIAVSNGMHEVEQLDPSMLQDLGLELIPIDFPGGIPSNFGDFFNSREVLYQNSFNVADTKYGIQDSVECRIEGPVGKELVEIFDKMFIDLSVSRYFKYVKNLIINFSSEGGLVTYGYQIINMIKRFQREYDKRVVMVADGHLMSMGLYIFCSADYRISFDNTQFMYHQVSSETWGKLYEIENSVQNLKQIQKKLNEYLMERTKIQKDFLEKFKKDDYCFNAKQAKRLGVIHEIY